MHSSNVERTCTYVPVVYVLITAIEPQNTDAMIVNRLLVSGLCVVPSNQLSNRVILRSVNHRTSGRLITTQLPPQT